MDNESGALPSVDAELKRIIGNLRGKVPDGAIAALMPSLMDAAYNAEYERKSIAVGDNNPEYRPYCLSCSTMRRMEHREYGYQCSVCGNKCSNQDQPARAEPTPGGSNE